MAAIDCSQGSSRTALTRKGNSVQAIELDPSAILTEPGEMPGSAVKTYNLVFIETDDQNHVSTLNVGTLKGPAQLGEKPADAFPDMFEAAYSKDGSKKNSTEVLAAAQKLVDFQLGFEANNSSCSDVSKLVESIIDAIPEEELTLTPPPG